MEQVTLRSSDNEEFAVDVKVANLSTTLKNLIDEKCASTAVPLPNVTRNTLTKVIEYCKTHSEASSKENLKDWDDEFMKVDQVILSDLIMAANVKDLLDLTCQSVAEMIKGKTPEEIRVTFDIKNDFTPKEEKEIHSENQWAFE